PAAFELQHRIDQYDRVIDHDPHQHDGTDQHDDRQRKTTCCEPDHDGGKSEWNRDHDQQRTDKRFEQGRHDSVDEEHRQEECKDQICACGIDLFALTAELRGHVLVERKILERVIHALRQTAHISNICACFDDRGSSSTDVTDL